MKWILLTIAVAGLIGLSFKSREKATPKKEMVTPVAGAFAPIAVLELFTSEGCSSCPPADKLLPKLAALDSHVISLSFHVDYWDRLGWKDPFSSHKFSERQREYNTHFGLDGSYTPQLIVNGSFEFVGSNRIAGENAVRKALLQKPTLEIAIEGVTITNNKISVTAKTTGEFDGTELQAALLQKNAETKILAGENIGATLLHTNVVRDFIKQTTAAKNEFQLQLPKSVSLNDCQIVVYVRQKADFKITGAAIYKPL